MRADVKIIELDRAAVLARRSEFEEVYALAFGAPGYDEPGDAARRFRAEQLPRHAGREGFRCVVALRGDRLLGFAYGYTGERGQWWSNHVATRAPAYVTERWLGGHFEFVELAVEPGEQGQGIGTALHDALLAGLPHERALLSTYRDDRPAPRLYRRRGWELLMAGLDDTSDLYGINLANGKDR
ncbi:MAG TPA: GNAT family N-acetyltransferase [Candidatus Limnocylindrales bacterium]|nr:GNAT family N-acetyltransferase [Candidatus Limnocylindrales bacterium]